MGPSITESALRVILGRLLIFVSLALSVTGSLQSKVHNVGPDQEYNAIGDVSWEALSAGDSIRIHWRAEPYHEKWVICVRGTQDRPVVVSGIPGPLGELPVIDGRNAVTRPSLNYWNEPRGIIKVGGANVPSDRMPAYITIENLDIRSGRPPYTYKGREGIAPYANNAAAIFIEKGQHVTIRNCRLSDCGNGFFCASKSADILVEGCSIRDNGIEDRFYEHNSYTEADGIVFQFNHYGPLRTGCLGNNLKDRSAGTVIRYNWIEDGNRQLDLVDSDHKELIDQSAYRETHVYGNILIEEDGQGNRQIVHYGGDSNDQDRYRKGTLYFYNNTVISTRTDRTTLFRLSSNDESAEVWNNVFYSTHPGDRLAISNADGKLTLSHNWLNEDWRKSHGNLTGTVESKDHLIGSFPGFADLDSSDYHLTPTSECRDAGIDHSKSSGHPVILEYVKPQSQAPRHNDQRIDLGAYEFVE
jgi:hypothetical protein